MNIMTIIQKRELLELGLKVEFGCDIEENNVKVIYMHV